MLNVNSNLNLITNYIKKMQNNEQIDENSIEIVHGDTSKIPFGMGSYGSRSLAVCGSAVVRATEKIINKRNGPKRPEEGNLGGQRSAKP